MVGNKELEKFVLNEKYNRQPLLVMKDMKGVVHAFIGVLSWTFCLRHKTMKDFKRLQLIPSYLYYLLKSSKKFSLSSKLEKIYCASVIFLRLEIPSYLCVSTSIPATQYGWTYSSNKIWGKTAKTHPLLSDGGSERKLETGINRNKELQQAAEVRSREPIETAYTRAVIKKVLQGEGVKTYSWAESPREAL